MPATALVAYATRYGSTQQVAEAVAATLREHGLAVDFTSMRNVRSLDAYSAVVLGAPLYIGHWHKDARQFLLRHHDGLARRPVAIFALGPLTNPRDETEWTGCRNQLDKDLAQYPWLAPVAVELFGGKLDPAQLRFPDTLLNVMPASPFKDMAPTDLRDWEAIRAWAADLAAKLEPAAPQPTGRA